MMKSSEEIEEVTIDSQDNSAQAIMPVVPKFRRILLVEDHEADAALTTRQLNLALENQIDIRVTSTLAEALDVLKQKSFEIILLDLSLPDSDGLASLKALKAEASHTPIIVLTGTLNEALGAQAVAMGAQDFLFKGDIDSKRLVRSLEFAHERFLYSQQSDSLDMPHLIASTELRLRDLEIDLMSHTIRRQGRETNDLTPNEFKIFLLLFENHDAIVNRTQIVDRIWEKSDAKISVRTIDRHISSIKKKCKHIGVEIHTIYGVGYRLILSEDRES